MRGGIMNVTARIVPLLVMLLLAPAFTDSGIVQAADLASKANIYTYPKPSPIGDLVLKNSSGKTVSLKDYRGKVVLLHFWSIRCPACKMEEPTLNKLKKAYGPAGLEVLGVNLSDPPVAVVRHAKNKRLPFPVLFDGGNGFSLQTFNMGGKNTSFVINPKKEALLEVPGLPTTYIIDCRGDVVAYSVGVARWYHQSAQGLLNRLIAERKTCGVDTVSGQLRTSKLW
jgi:thiol-disulfide isomerase/thioredoxin